MRRQVLAVWSVLLAVVMSANATANVLDQDHKKDEFALNVRLFYAPEDLHPNKSVLMADIEFQNNSGRSVCVSPGSFRGPGLFRIYPEGEKYPIKYTGPEDSNRFLGPWYMVPPAHKAAGVSDISSNYDFRNKKTEYHFTYRVIVYDCRFLMDLFERKEKDLDQQFEAMRKNGITISARKIRFSYPQN